MPDFSKHLEAEVGQMQQGSRLMTQLVRREEVVPYRGATRAIGRRSDVI